MTYITLLVYLKHKVFHSFPKGWIAMEIKHGKKEITISLPTAMRTKMQRYMFNELIKSNSVINALDYAKSFTGEAGIINRISNERYKWNLREDKLAIKKPLSIWGMQDALFNPNKSHAPSKLDAGQWIGVEIECFIPCEKFGDGNDYCESYCDNHEDECCNCGCDHDCNRNDNNYLSELANYIKNEKIKRVSVKDDGSIDEDEGYFSAELTITFNRNDRTPLERLCKLLNKLGARVNKSCGMHVHLDQRDIYQGDESLPTLVTKRAKNLGACLPYFSKLVPKSRLTNHFCQLGVSRMVGQRYWAINLTALRKYKTIEVRMHSSTTDFEKINNWIDLLLLTSRNETKLPQIKTLDDLCMNVNVPEKLIAYLEAREAKFKAEHVEEPNAGELDSMHDHSDLVTITTSTSHTWSAVDVNASTGTITYSTLNNAREMLMNARPYDAAADLPENIEYVQNQILNARPGTISPRITYIDNNYVYLSNNKKIAFGVNMSNNYDIGETFPNWRSYSSEDMSISEYNLYNQRGA